MSSKQRTFLLCHGAWGGGWSWKKMHALMQAAGHKLLAPNYTGLGDRIHLANPDVGLGIHITDIVNVIKYEDLHDIVLLGHSYGGMVATGVADCARDLINQIIYLDAFVPRDGQSLFDFLPQSERQRMRDGAAAGDNWRIPPNPTPPDTPPEDIEWLNARRAYMPIKCFETKLKLTHGETDLPRSYIYCSRKQAGADPFAQFAKRLKDDSLWRYFEMDASHSPNVTAPAALMKVLQEIVA